MSTSKDKEYSKEVIEIADVLFAKPDRRVSEVVSYFVGKCRKNKRTIERWVKKAKEYNQHRLKKQEKAKDEVLIGAAKEAAKNDVLTRLEAEVILSNIAKGRAKRVEKDILVPSPGEQVRAIDKLAQLNGWDAPTKSEVEVSDKSLKEVTVKFGAF
jgi:thioesterase domain-containing protein